jgi:haloalkane dehalogenase
MLEPSVIAWCATNIAAIEIAEHDVIAGHHTPEDQPDAIAATLATWLDKHQLRTAA